MKHEDSVVSGINIAHDFISRHVSNQGFPFNFYRDPGEATAPTTYKGRPLNRMGIPLEHRSSYVYDPSLRIYQADAQR